MNINVLFVSFFKGGGLEVAIRGYFILQERIVHAVIHAKQLFLLILLLLFH